MGEARVRGVVMWLAWAWLALALGACRESHGAEAGTETNWLRVCQDDVDCAVGNCVCGRCSEACSDDEDCPSGLRCEGESSALYTSSCGVDLEVRGLCAPTCDDDPQCGTGLACDDGACAPQERPRPGDGGASELPGGSGAFSSAGTRQLVIDAHLQQTPDCLPDLERPIGSGAGTYDIAVSGGGSLSSESCASPYRLVLRVRNLLPEDVLVTEVRVLLMSTQRQTIVFSQTTPVLPNPLALSVTGSVPADGLAAIIAEAIPIDYGEQLGMFVGGQIAIRAQLTGESLSGEVVHSNVFEYRVQLCDGCLSLCGTAIDGVDISLDEVLGGTCADNAGADGRVCIDPDC